MQCERSLSPSSTAAQNENKETEELSPEPILSVDEKDYVCENRNTEFERPEKESEKDVVSDHLPDISIKNNEATSNLDGAEIAYKKRRPATNNLNPNLLSW